MNSSDTLTQTEKTALLAASEALVLIRMLARQPLTAESVQIIESMADAFHNVPAHCAGPAAQRQANAFLMEAAIRDARRVYDRHGLASRYLPTEV